MQSAVSGSQLTRVDARMLGCGLVSLTAESAIFCLQGQAGLQGAEFTLPALFLLIAQLKHKEWNWVSQSSQYCVRKGKRTEAVIGSREHWFHTGDAISSGSYLFCAAFYIDAESCLEKLP